MLGRVEQCVSLRKFDDAPQIHHPDTSADVVDDSEIVGNEQIREIELVLQIHQQIDDLCLDRYVQCRNRLVANNQLWVEC